MKYLKRILCVFVFSFLMIIPVSALDTSLKVYDDADLLTESEEIKLRELALNFVEQYDMDIVLVTTSNNNGKGTQDYAQDFYDYNEFGLNDTYDGLLFLIDRTYGYNDTWITTTGQAILVYDDIRIDSILDDIYYSKDYGYYSMFETFIESSSKYAAMGIAESNENMYIDEYGNYLQKRNFNVFKSLALSIVVSTVIVVIFLLRNRMVKKATYAREYLDKKSISFSRKDDRFISSHTDKTYSPRDTGSSGGSRRSGGSSISRGSSGRSHGGGGRRM